MGLVISEVTRTSRPPSWLGDVAPEVLRRHHVDDLGRRRRGAGITGSRLAVPGPADAAEPGEGEAEEPASRVRDRR